MRARIFCTALAITMALVGSRVLAQEIIATPDPVGGTTISPGTSAQAVAPAQSTPANWRYRWHEGRWWYWTPQNRWMWYSDDGKWVEYDANHAPPAANRSDEYPSTYYGYSPSPGQYYSSPGYYSPSPGYYYRSPGYYWRGYYPGVAVGVRPYGNVNVGVGPRVGVNVWGPHGGVHVGRIHVGW